MDLQMCPNLFGARVRVSNNVDGDLSVREFLSVFCGSNSGCINPLRAPQLLAPSPASREGIKRLVAPCSGSVASESEIVALILASRPYLHGAQSGGYPSRFISAKAQY